MENLWTVGPARGSDYFRLYEPRWGTFVVEGLTRPAAR